MRQVLPLLKPFSAGLIKIPVLGLAAVAFLSGAAPHTQRPNASLPGFVSFDAAGAGTTPSALQGTAALGIDASGQIVGIVTDAGGVHHGYIRGSDGTITITEFDAPGAGTGSNQGTFALGIDTAGDVTGYYMDSQQVPHGYVRSASGTFTEFQQQGFARNKGTYPIAISPVGVVTGFYSDTDLIGVHGFLRSAAGVMTVFDIPGGGPEQVELTYPVAINAAGTTTGFLGTAGPPGDFTAWVRDAGGHVTSFFVPGAGNRAHQGTFPIAIDAAGDITGFFIDANTTAHGFLRTADGTISAFDATGAGTGIFQGTFPIGINSSGTIVGLDFDANYTLHGFTRAANGTLATLDAPGAGVRAGSAGSLQSFQGTGAFGINDSGGIAGSYLDSSSVTHGFVIAAPAVAPASFTVTGSAVSLSRGATSGNTSTITVTPSNFTGPVALTAAVTTSPSGAVDPPTLSFGTTTPVNITGTTPGTATLTIATTAPTLGSLASPRHRELRWYGAGGAVLACVLFFGAPARRRGWMRLLSLLLLFAATGGVVLGCSGSGGGSISTGPSNPGTTPGSYVVTVTGTSGSTTATGTVALTVQ